MPKLLGFNSILKEGKALENIGKNIAARLDIEEWHARIMHSLDKYLGSLDAGNGIDICCIDIVPKEAIAAAEQTRSILKEALMLLIAEPNISPMLYLKPDIMATSLLLRPYSAMQADKAITELIQKLLENDEASETAGESFVVETKRDKLQMQFSKILYFEAKERKIQLCTEDARQFSFYDTLDGLSKTLPDQFVRCHKGFIVNRGKIERVVFADNMIYLKGNYCIPVSRSYKNVIREALL